MIIQEDEKIGAEKKTKSVFLVADLNDDPPESDGEELADAEDDEVKLALIQGNQASDRTMNDEVNRMETSPSVRDPEIKDPDIVDVEDKRVSKQGKCRLKVKSENPLDFGQDTDADLQSQGFPASQEEKISSLKAGLVHVARKMPKNAHTHFILGLMYQRLCQPHKAVLSFEKASEILQQAEDEISRPEFLSLVQIHHAQCVLQVSMSDGSDKELDSKELDEIVQKLKKSVSSDVRQAGFWNILGQLFIRSGLLQSAITILTTVLMLVPDYLDSLANLGVAYLQRGNLVEAAKCFQALILKDQNHPGALVNYGALLLCQYGSVIAGAGAYGNAASRAQQITAAAVAQECFAAAIKSDPKSGHLWVNLANAYYMAGDHVSAAKCLEQASKLEPNRMTTRYAVALHRTKDAERSQDPNQQLSWAANEMASIIREGDSASIDPRIAWAGLAMVQRAQLEIAAGFHNRDMDLKEVEERALHTLQQAISQDPDDYIQWHQLGLHFLCTLQFKKSLEYLKASVVRATDSGFAWSNLGISLQLCDDPKLAEEAYKRALSLSAPEESHVPLCNLGNLYRQQKRLEDACQMFAKSIEKCPGYAPAYNNLGLVFVAEGRLDDAIDCFNKALAADPLLDAAKSNLMKAETMTRLSVPKVPSSA